jgi:Ca2+-transporting ATPase
MPRKKSPSPPKFWKKFRWARRHFFAKVKLIIMKNQGLSENEVLELRKKFGENIIPLKEKVSWFSVLLAQLKSPLIYILVIVGFVSLFFKEYTDAGLIGFVVILNILMGFFQEYNAQKTLIALRKILKPKAIVIRNGERKEIEVREIVPGDSVILEAGDKVPADGYLIKGVNLLVNESILTGEEEAVEKNENEDRNNLFMGTTIISGRGIMEVTKIGKETEMGKIGQSLAEIKEEKTPLQLRLEKFTQNLVKIVLLVCLFIFLIGIFHQEEIWKMLKFSIILSIAAIPEGLPIAVTVILALGMRKILKRNGLVKKLLSIETLGSTSVICTDKTGTLTEGKMQVVRADFFDKEKALLALTLTNEQKSNLEVALWNYVEKENLFNPREVFNSTWRIYEEPFDSEKKYAMTINKIRDKDIAFIVGAPEIILSFCDIPINEKNNILIKIDHWASQGLRVVGAALKDSGGLKEKQGYIWLGLVGIEDPVREGIKEAILIAQEAGIKIKIVTGDYRKTAEKIATKLGFNLRPENILEGQELEKISDESLKRKIDDIILFTRVTPHQKLKIVKALQEKGEIVAMTGDGVNDAPALKKADIGVVVGSASDVAKEAGDLILIDSNFKTIVAACEEGRLILSNIKKVIGYVLSNSFAEIVLIFGAILLDLPSPLTVVQILWIHLICDGPPDIMLAFEPKEKMLMKEKPKDIKKESILPNFMIFLIFTISLITGLLSLLLFHYFFNQTENLNLARTISFAAIATVSLVYIFAFKNLKKLIIQTENFFQNKYLFFGILYGFFLIFLAIYLPRLNHILGTTPLRPFHWLLVFSVAFIVTFSIEASKLLHNEKTKD